MQSQFLQPGIILLREGTDTSQGKGQLISNINACQAVADILRTTLGPLGMDKLVYSSNSLATISNDGAEILKLMEIVHPCAKILVDIAKSQDLEVGDGTTSVTLLACELLKQAKELIEIGYHPQTIIRYFRKANLLGREYLNKQLKLTKEDMLKKLNISDRELVKKCAETSLNSKLISRNKELFGELVVAAVEITQELHLIGIKKVTGGSVSASKLIKGIAFKKTFSYAGFEQQPKKLLNPKILCLNIELELKSEKDNAEITVEGVKQYQEIVDAEWTIIYDKLEAIARSGATVVLSRLAIGDLATQYFADRNIFSAGRVPGDDLERVCEATGAKVQSSCRDVEENAKSLGTCGSFEEVQMGSERFNTFTECVDPRACTILLRGGSEQYLSEAERSVHDALSVAKFMMDKKKDNLSVVVGGGCVEMQLMKFLNKAAKEQFNGKAVFVVEAFAKALEVIPRQLCVNGGLDPTAVLSRLYRAHYNSDNVEYFGVEYGPGTGSGTGIADLLRLKQGAVLEPVGSKVSILGAATEAACLVLGVDETVRNPKSEQANMENRGQLPGGAGGAPGKNMMSEAMGGKGLRGMPGVRAMKGRGGK